MSVHRISIVKTVQSYNFSPIYPSSCRKNFPRPCILSFQIICNAEKRVIIPRKEIFAPLRLSVILHLYENIMANGVKIQSRFIKLIITQTK